MVIYLLEIRILSHPNKIDALLQNKVSLLDKISFYWLNLRACLALGKCNVQIFLNLKRRQLYTLVCLALGKCNFICVLYIFIFIYLYLYGHLYIKS